VNAPLPNRAPTVLLGGPYEVVASTDFLLGSVVAQDPDDDTLAFQWTASAGAFDDPTAATPTWTAPNTTGVYALSVEVRDTDGATASASANVLVYEPTTTNQPPSANPGGPYLVETGNSIPLDGSQSSDLDGDPLAFAWTAEYGTFDDASSPTPSYQAPSLPTVDPLQLTVDDGKGGVDAAYTDVVVYDPNGGFVVGSGSFYSQPGAMPGATSAEGVASFRLLASYRPGRNTPDGQTRFEFRTGGLRMTSTSYEWLVVSGATASFKGEAVLGDESTVRFRVWAHDGEPDKIRIKIWGDQGVIYDNGVESELTLGMIRIQRP
jgi:hypothetical protein